MKIALGQVKFITGQFEKNYLQIQNYVRQAEEKGADLIILPALSVCGPALAEKWAQKDIVDQIISYDERIIPLSEKTVILFGTLERRKTGLCSVIRLACRGQIIKPEELLNFEEVWYRDVFGDDRYLQTDNCTSCYTINGEKLYVSERPFENQDGISVHLINKPYFLKDDRKLEGIVVSGCGAVNNGHNVFSLEGNSGMFVEGKKVWGCQPFEPGVAFQDETGSFEEPGLLEAVTHAIRYFDENVFYPGMKWIIGLSGGLDSSVNAALLVRALGPERVVGYNMATHYNSAATINNARILAEKLGMQIREGSIEPLVDASKAVLIQYGYTDEYPSLVYENIQARIRGHMLSTFASVENGVIVNNGNKVETALGYCTLYGDAIGCLCPLADLTKVQMFELVKDINADFGREVVPMNLVPEIIDGNIEWETPPSAELRDNQKDPMKWFYHDWLIDKIMADPDFLIGYLQSYLDGSVYETEAGRWIRYYGLDDARLFVEDINWVRKNMARNVFKRLQAPPVIAFTDYAYGSLRNEVQGNWQEKGIIGELLQKISEQ